MSRTSNRALLALCLLAACGNHGKDKAAPDPSSGSAQHVDAGTGLHKTPVVLQKAREDLLLLDDSITKLLKEINAAEKAGDANKVAGLRQRESAFRQAYEKQQQHIHLLELMWKRQQQEGPIR